MAIDFRARLRPKGRNYAEVLGEDNEDNIMQPLWRTSGLMFPYTPTVSGTGNTANYDTWEFTHSNYQQQTYKNSVPNDINISAKFTAQTEEEAAYMLAAIYFFRSATKMYFGESDAVNVSADVPGLAGLPPPVLYFNYLGAQMYNNVPVVVKTFDMDLPDTVDYVPVVRSDNDISYVPAFATMNIILAPQYNPNDIKSNFNLTDFRQGKLLGRGYI